MRIQVLGVGDENSPELGNPSLILWVDGKGFLINCGYTIFPKLFKSNLISKIEKIFIVNKEANYAGSLDSLLKYRMNFLGKKTKFYGIQEHLPYLKTIDMGYQNNIESYFIVGESDSIMSMPVQYKDGMVSEGFYNFGVLYSGPASESLLDTPQAFDAKVIIHDVSFGAKPGSHVDFIALARASNAVKRKTWLIGYHTEDLKSNEAKVRNHGFAGLLALDQDINM